MTISFLTEDEISKLRVVRERTRGSFTRDELVVWGVAKDLSRANTWLARMAELKWARWQYAEGYLTRCPVCLKRLVHAGAGCACDRPKRAAASSIPRDQRVSVALREDERELVRGQAQASGLEVSTWIRKAIKAYIRASKTPT